MFLLPVSWVLILKIIDTWMSVLWDGTFTLECLNLWLFLPEVKPWESDFFQIILFALHLRLVTLSRKILDFQTFSRLYESWIWGVAHHMRCLLSSFHTFTLTTICSYFSYMWSYLLSRYIRLLCSFLQQNFAEKSFP